MKPNSLFISGGVLLHLFVIDLTMYVLNPVSPQGVYALAGYNLIWLVVALNIGTQYFHQTNKH